MQISQKNRFLLILFTESKQLDPAEFTKEHPEGAYKNITSGPWPGSNQGITVG